VKGKQQRQTLKRNSNARVKLSALMGECICFPATDIDNVVLVRGQDLGQRPGQRDAPRSFVIRLEFTVPERKTKQVRQVKQRPTSVCNPQWGRAGSGRWSQVSERQSEFESWRYPGYVCETALATRSRACQATSQKGQKSRVEVAAHSIDASLRDLSITPAAISTTKVTS
jgi:hypothetical protein